jgi:hypothetical protein
MGNEQEAGKGMQIFLRQLARPQAQADALRLQPVGEDFLALPDEAVDEADNVDDRDSSVEGLLHADLEDEHLSEKDDDDDDDEASEREALEGKGEKNKLPYWLIITPEDSRINGPRVRLRFQRGRLTPEEARAVVMRAERSIAHLVRRVNQEILLWYVVTVKFFALLLLLSLPPPCQRHDTRAHGSIFPTGRCTRRRTARRCSFRHPRATKRRRHNAAPGKTTSSFTSARRYVPYHTSFAFHFIKRRAL